MGRQATLDELSAILGDPQFVRMENAVEEDGTPVRITLATWDCGCAGTGPSYFRLDVEPCEDHRGQF